MKTTVKWLAITLTLGLPLVGAQVSAGSPADSVVKIFTQMRLPNPVRPWIKQNPVEVMGSGVIIDGKRILTNAHLVLYADEVFVQGGRGGDRVEAKVVAIGPGIDLAVLTLEDDSFFAKRPAISRAAKLPEITSRVAVQGFPVGGNSLSTTQGTVARIEYEFYETGAAGLRIQVDATINPGNSGGPALIDGKMIGVVYGHADNIGYIIPNQEIDDFLADVADGRYEGKPYIFDQLQTMENEALRGKLGVSSETMVFRRKAMLDATESLMSENGIPRRGTDDVLAVWNGKGGKSN